MADITICDEKCMTDINLLELRETNPKIILLFIVACYIIFNKTIESNNTFENPKSKLGHE